ncbi:BQ5605_C013g07160 [Microbotryum silenes-dioicae]|uniref:BQ5605_C013g07160 protein n=1 Tax=Microbotryum silenes-dioicae TaxID=796604 RepID=A0A2X0LUF3_9BASI|nr:BQ5605_C013g07160 [Microbotryum silenes-dioicae]
MDGQDRRASLQLGRQARKEAASPYARPKASPASANAGASASGTPSRLSGLLSYLSPFRRGKKKERSPEPQPASDDEQDHNNDHDHEEPQHSDGSDDDAQHAHAPAFELHGDFIEDHDMHANAPPSPTPYQNIYPNLGSSITASKSMPQLASTLASNATPRPRGGFTSAMPRSATRADLAPFSASAASWGQAESVFGSERSAPGRANEELARFFRDKADRGDEPLTAIEQAGVLHLVQQAKAENLPTAFTPNFGSASPTLSVQPFYARQDSVVPISPSAASNDSTFGGVGASPSTLNAEFTAGHTPYRRRRPIYVGAGYSSRSARRNRTPGSHSASNGSNLTRSQSEGGSLNSLGANSSAAEGKRRRVEAEDAPPAPSTSNLSYAASPGPSAPASPSPAAAMTDSSKTSIFSRAKITANAVSTPVRPSPLWQVSKAETPSPSPPKRVASGTPRSTTRAADMMMDIIRQEDAARPHKISPTTGREAFINPYESTDHNPLARIPRSRPVRPPTPSRPALARVAAQKAASAAPSPKKVSPLEQLERSMPAEYRREDGNRSKLASSVASASPAPTPQKEAAPAPTFAPPSMPVVATKPSTKKAAPANPFAALASETDEADDDEDGSREEDEEDDDEEEDDKEDEENEEEDSDDDIVIIEEVVKKPTPTPKPKTVFIRKAPALKTSAPAPSAPTSKPVDQPASVGPMFGTPSSNMFGQTSLVPSKQPPTGKPAPTPEPAVSFSFGAISAAPVETPKAAAPKHVVSNGSSITLVDSSDAQKQALEASRTSLPTFVFAGTWNTCTGRGEAAEATTRAAQDLARMMSRGEVPTFEFKCSPI